VGEEPAKHRPNLLVIVTDEHHYGTLSCYGGKIVQTTHIDSLAKEGATCTSFYATTPVCSPSRAAFVSGLYPQNTPVVTNNISLDDKIVTFAELLRRRGYATGYAGKWHLDGAGKPQWAPKRKFGFDDNRFMFNRGHWKKLEDSKTGPRVAARNARGKPDYGVKGADQKSFATDWLTDKAIDFVRTNREKPFCYVLSLPDPHGPNSVRSPYDTMYADVEVPIPSTLKKTAAETPGWAKPTAKVNAAALRRLMPAYYGMVKCIDDNVGRLLAVLRKDGVLDRTIVVFTSDHGDLCGEHGRLNKGVPYEGSARVPFLLRFPSKVKAGTRIDEALSCVDFLPTVLPLMGVDVPSGVEGRDASGLFTGSRPSTWHDVAIFRSTPGNIWICAVSDRYKLVFSQSDRPWLFDLEKDPHERRNLFGDPERRPFVRQLAIDLAAYGTKSGDVYCDHPKIRAEIAAAAK
jgi:arylsulfatase A-like enzyme